jgi:hypothetical protein
MNRAQCHCPYCTMVRARLPKGACRLFATVDLGYTLVSPDGRSVWCGPGMKPLDSVPFARMVRFPNRKAAQKAADGLRKAIGLHVKVQSLSWHGG